jgi:5-carboxymethyl-2-hydroxymuconate isomerase
MPQVLVEYSGNIAEEADIPGLLKLIADTIQEAGRGAFAVAAVKVKGLGYEHYVVGDGDPENAFVSISVRVAKGRPEEDRRRTFDAVFAAVKQHLRPVDERRTLAISMDVEEFGERLAYKQNRLHEKFGTKPFAQTIG